ncbi:MAG: hypothetical protein IPO66_18865 [Rhodanobacteraceae bacterium]|nr:hypothetical protein [Rhodanobacteraceae bacterium]
MPWLAQSQLRQLQAHHLCVAKISGAGSIGKKRKRLPLAGIIKHLNRPPPGTLLPIVDLPQVKHMPLQHPATGEPSVLDDAQYRWTLPSFLRVVRAKHEPLLSARAPAKDHKQGLHYSHFSQKTNAACIADQSLTSDAQAKIARNEVESRSRNRGRGQRTRGQEGT